MNQETILLQILQETKGINIRIDGLEQRFDGLEQKFGVLEENFEIIEQCFDKLENRVVENFATLQEIIKDEIIGVRGELNNVYSDTQKLSKVIDWEEAKRNKVWINLKNIERIPDIENRIG